MSLNICRARYARIAVASLLALRFVGCNMPPATPYGRGPQADPDREIHRLNYLMRQRHYTPDEAYLTRVRIAELKTSIANEHRPDIDDYNAIVRSAPDRPEAIVSYSRALVAQQAELGQWFRYPYGALPARRWLDRLIARNAHNGEYALLSAQLARIAGTPDVGDEELTRAYFLLPNDPRVSILLAQQAIDHEQPDKAIRSLFLARQQMPKSAQIHYLSGQVCELQDDPTVALDEYDKALQLNPKHVDALAAKTLLLWSRNDPRTDSAERQLALTVRDHPVFTFFEGLRCWNNGHYSIGLQYLEGVSERYPSNRIFRATFKKMNDKYNEGMNNMFAAGAVMITGIIIAGAVADADSHHSARPNDPSNDDARQQESELNDRLLHNLIHEDEEADRQAAEQRERDRDMARQQQEEQEREMKTYRGQHGY